MRATWAWTGKLGLAVVSNPYRFQLPKHHRTITKGCHPLWSFNLIVRPSDLFHTSSLSMFTSEVLFSIMVILHLKTDDHKVMFKFMTRNLNTHLIARDFITNVKTSHESYLVLGFSQSRHSQHRTALPRHSWKQAHNWLSHIWGASLVWHLQLLQQSLIHKTLHFQCIEKWALSSE